MSDAQSVVEQVARQVVDSINDNPGKFSMPFISRMWFVPELELSDTKHLTVTAVPGGHVSEILDRGSDEEEYVVELGIQKRDADKMENARISQLLMFTETAKDFLRRRNFKLDDGKRVVWLGVENDPPYIPGHVREWNQFTSVLTLTYRVVR